MLVKADSSVLLSRGKVNIIEDKLSKGGKVSNKEAMLVCKYKQLDDFYTNMILQNNDISK